jgi:hypothetical protein
MRTEIERHEADGCTAAAALTRKFGSDTLPPSSCQ